MAMHTQNLKADPRASLLVTQLDGEAIRWAQRGSRWWEMSSRSQSRSWRQARKLYLERYANSKYWVDFEDFSFYRMDIVDVYYVGGFGVMGWVAASEYGAAQPDPLADAMAGIIEHMNADHKDSLILLARKFAGIEAEEAAMTSVDRLGFQVRLKTAEGVRGARIAFLREVSSAAETRGVLVEMVEQARQG